MSQIEKFGKYMLLEKVATGGMAEIYLAKAPGASGINKFVAIKRILPQYSDNPEFIEMFKYEAKIAINLAHSNIVSIYEFGVEKGQFFLVMDYVEGKNLRQIINRMKQQKETFQIEQILYIIREVASGLDSAHRCLDGTTGRPLNITHRDMSPQNIMISYEGEIKIVDFGIAKAESQIESTKAGTLKGKFGYMSPEQAEGIQVDLRTDVFSLGIVMWELLANDRLFVANNEMNTLRKIRDCQIPSLKKINPRIPDEIEKIVNKALTRDRNLRYQTAAAFHRDVNTFLNKHYPAFSPHDFSAAVKTLFADEILEIKKRLVEFANISEHSVRISAASENSANTDSEVTVTPTPTGQEATAMTETPVGETSGDLEQDFKNILVTTIKQKVDNPRPSRARTSESSRTGTFTRATKSGNQKPRVQYKSAFPQLVLTSLGIFILAYALIASDLSQIRRWLETNVVGGNKPVTSVSPSSPSSQSADDTKYAVSVYSSPPQAEIHIDGKDTGFTTPATLKLDPMKSYEISLKLAGFIIYRTEYFADKQTDRLEASLQKTSEGFISINVYPGTAIVYINGQRIPEKPPIKKYAVPANKDILIRAEDPITQAQATQVINVEENKVKRIDLFLNTNHSNKKKR